MKDPEELAINIDITTRTAIFALARICNKDEIEMFYDALKDDLAPAYESDKLLSLINICRYATRQIHNGLSTD